MKPIARGITQGRINYGIKFTICSTMLLYSKERQITIIDTRLQETKPTHNQGKNATILNKRSNQQAQRDKVLQ